MYRAPSQQPTRRRGTLALPILVSMVLVALLALVLSFAWFSLHYQDARTACEAAALAGASQLMDDAPLFPAPELGTPPAARVARAKELAIRYLCDNLNMHDDTLRQSLWNWENAASGPLVAIHWPDTTTPTDAIPWCPTDWPSELPVNGLVVRLGRGASPGWTIGPWTARLFGFLTPELSGEAVAVVDQRVAGFRQAGSTRAPVIPLVVVLPNGLDDWRGTIDAYAPLETQKGQETTTNGIPELTLVFATESPDTATPDVDAAPDKTAAPASPPPVVFLLALPELIGDPADLAAAIRLGLPTASMPSIAGELRQGQTVPLLPLSESQQALLASLLIETRGEAKVWPVVTPLADGLGIVTHFVGGRITACEMVEQADHTRRLHVTVEPCLLHTPTAIVESSSPWNDWIGKLMLVR